MVKNFKTFVKKQSKKTIDSKQRSFCKRLMKIKLCKALKRKKKEEECSRLKTTKKSFRSERREHIIQT